MRIQTRESLRTIKTFDRAKCMTEKMRSGAGEVKEYGEELQHTRYESANEYAGNAIENAEEKTARNVAYGAGRVGNWGLRETRHNIQKWQNSPKKVKVQHQRLLSSPKRPALKIASGKTVKSAQKGAKCAQQTAKTTAKATKMTAKAAQKAAMVAKQVVVATAKATKVAVKAVITAVKATVATIKGISAAIAAGGWIAIVVILFICITGLVVGCVCGTYEPSPDSDGDVTVVQMMPEADVEY